MIESFEQLLEESFIHKPMRPGSTVRGTVMQITSDYVVINAGLKSEGVIDVEQFYNDQKELEIEVGDEVDVVLEALEDSQGEIRFSREKAKRAEAWTNLNTAFEAGETVKGWVRNKIKGGFIVELGTIQAFLPGSLVDVRPVRDIAIEGKELEFKVIKLEPSRNNIVLSRRAVMESEGNSERENLLSSLEEGKIITGVVKNLTEYGAFVDLGGLDGLLHITDMSWRRVKHPNEVVAIGDEIKVVILKLDRERGRVSLGLKQMINDPWSDLVSRYPLHSRLTGRVTNVTDYGCFVELEEGVEGLVHASEMDWTNKNVSPNKVVQVGMQVEVMVLDIDAERRRISLGLKQCQSNPWQAFSSEHAKGDLIKGKIKSITDFGLFVGLPANIDGLIHLSDLSWNVPGEEAVRQFKKGDEIEAIILSIDPERERISLGIKQIKGDPQSGQVNFLTKFPKGSLVKGEIINIDDKGMQFSLEDNTEGYLKFQEEGMKLAGLENTNIGDTLELEVIGMDRKNLYINLELPKNSE